MPFPRLLAAGALLALPLAAHADDIPRIAPGDTLLTLTAEGEASRAPDMATLSAGVATTGSTGAAAMAANAAAMNRVIAALKSAGIADRDIQTSQISLQPDYTERANGDEDPPRITGYRASNQVSLRVHRLAGLGAVIDALVSAGANQVDGPDFTLETPAPALDEARVAAIAAARARAELYAKAAGLHVLRILAIAENGGGDARPMPKVFMAAARAAPTPVASGTVSYNASVSVSFELAP